MRSKEEIKEKLTALQKENSDAEAKRDPVTDPCQSWQIERGASSSRQYGRLDSIGLFFSYEQICWEFHLCLCGHRVDRRMTSDGGRLRCE